MQTTATKPHKLKTAEQKYLQRKKNKKKTEMRKESKITKRLRNYYIAKQAAGLLLVLLTV